MDPNPNPNPNSSPPARHPKANKRTPAQKAADAIFIQTQHLRGKGIHAIAAMITTIRPYSLSHAQVQKDLEKLKNQWLQQAADSIAVEKKRALRKLDLLEEELWDAWDRSKKDELQRTMGMVTPAAADGSADADAKGSKNAEARKTDNVRKINRDGDASFTRQILDIHNARMKLLGLEAPVKQEISGVGGGPIVTVNATVGLNDEEQEAILARHLARSVKKNDDNPPAEPSSSEAADTA